MNGSIPARWAFGHTDAASPTYGSGGSTLDNPGCDNGCNDGAAETSYVTKEKLTLNINATSSLNDTRVKGCGADCADSSPSLISPFVTRKQIARDGLNEIDGNRLNKTVRNELLNGNPFLGSIQADLLKQKRLDEHLWIASFHNNTSSSNITGLSRFHGLGRQEKRKGEEIENQNNIQTSANSHTNREFHPLIYNVSSFKTSRLKMEKTIPTVNAILNELNENVPIIQMSNKARIPTSAAFLEQLEKKTKKMKKIGNSKLWRGASHSLAMGNGKGRYLSNHDANKLGIPPITVQFKMKHGEKLNHDEKQFQTILNKVKPFVSEYNRKLYKTSVSKVFLETQSTMKVDTTFPGGVELSGPPLREVISTEIVDHVSEHLAQQLRLRFGDELGPRLSNSISRSSTRALTLEMTGSLTQSLTRVLFDLLSLSLTTVTTRKLTETLVPSLTHTLAPIIVHSLTHDPKSDYYCWYCRKEGIYCGMCRESISSDYKYDHNAGYYANYYSNYYTKYYGSYYSDKSVQNYFEKTGRTHTSRMNQSTKEDIIM